MDTPDFQTHKAWGFLAYGFLGCQLHAGFEAGRQYDSDARQRRHSGARVCANPESRDYRINNRDESWAQRNPLGRAGEHSELANLASFLISDQAGYINGEMVVQDGGAHLRSSGAEDLLQWTDAQWENQRAARSKGCALWA